VSDWIPWEVEEDHPCFHAFERVRTKEFAQIYEQQKKLLEKLLEKDDLDIFVASFLIHEDQESGRLRSACSWTRDVVALLPGTDLVCFVDPLRPRGEELVGCFPWDQVERCCGHLLKRADHRPRRFHVESFPSEEHFREMASARVQI
jgi:hypothetical protein